MCTFHDYHDPPLVYVTTAIFLHLTRHALGGMEELSS